MSVFRPLHGFTRMLQRLSGMLVPGQVIFFSMMRGGSSVRVRGEFVEFGSSLVRIVWHSIFRLRNSLHPKTVLFFTLFNIGHFSEVSLPRVKRKGLSRGNGIGSRHWASEGSWGGSDLRIQNM